MLSLYIYLSYTVNNASKQCKNIYLHNQNTIENNENIKSCLFKLVPKLIILKIYTRT